MPQLISRAAQSSNQFDTLIPTVFDYGNIQDAFIFYHYGIEEYGQEPATKSIHRYLKDSNDVLGAIQDSANISESFLNSASSSIYNSNIYREQIEQVNLNNRIQNIRKFLYLSFIEKNESYTPGILDNNSMIIFSSNQSVELLIPDDSEISLEIGYSIKILNTGTDIVEIVPKNIANIRGDRNTAYNNDSFLLYKRAENDWIIIQ